MSKEYECLKSVFAPKVSPDGTVIRSYPYQPGEKIIFDDKDVTETKEVHAKELVESGHLGNKGDYAKLLKVQEKAAVTGMSLTSALASLAKEKAKNDQLQDELNRLQAQISKSKTRY